MKNLLKSRLIVICGYYGSGKTNIAVNLALTAADCGKGVVIVDLDTVNPYFRTADNAVLLRERGVITLIPEFANTNVDIPALPPAFPTVFERDETVIVDVGGGAEGSAVLGGFRNDFEKCGYDMYYVFNANRPENTDTESALLSLKEIEISSGMHFTGIINNTHMCGETDQKTIEKGVAQATEFASAAGLPMLATTAFHSYLPGVSVMRDVTKKFF